MTGPDGERLAILFTESSRNFGGQERRLLREALWLLEAGHRVRIATPPEGILYERSRNAGVPTDAVPMRGAAEPGSLSAVLRILRRHRVDVIYSHSGKDSWIGAIAGLVGGVPLVRSRELITPVRHAFAYNLLPRKVLACSEAVRRQLIECGVDGRKVFVQYPPVDTAAFRGVSPEAREAVRRELGLDKRYPVVTCAGEFRAEKRQVDLVHAMLNIRVEFPDALLLLAGRDSGVTGVRSAAEAAGVSGSVRFLGEREDMPAILANTDVYAFPSSLEPFGMGPVEAMAAGVPVVATSVGGLAEIVTDGVNGLLVPPLAPAALAGAVVRLCREAGLRERLIAAGRERANDFDAAGGMERLTLHFREVARR
ncbi:MAG: glycosyltransferase family 1 protein [Deltaproteobacteria bacterium]|nr:MAG: glycosyltransferase family 1 protein [Deltaproteobacteria bacterium]